MCMKSVKIYLISVSPFSQQKVFLNFIEVSTQNLGLVKLSVDTYFINNEHFHHTQNCLDGNLAVFSL